MQVFLCDISVRQLALYPAPPLPSMVIPTYKELDVAQKTVHIFTGVTLSDDTHTTRYAHTAPAGHTTAPHAPTTVAPHSRSGHPHTLPLTHPAPTVETHVVVEKSRMLPERWAW